MANLYGTFTKTGYTPHTNEPPVESGANARTDVLLITSSSQPSGIVAESGENILSVYAGADCWLAIGPTPVAENTFSSSDDYVNCHFVANGERRHFSISEGDKFAVIQT